MTEHPIQGLMKTAMENIKEMVDVNTIVGDPVETPDGSVILPISKVGFGFAAGGSEFLGETDQDHHLKNDARNAVVSLPFGGGSGGGVSITPIAFLVVNSMGVKVVPLDNQTHLYERLIDSAPQVFDKIQSMLKGKSNMQGTAGMGAASTQGTAGMGTASMQGTAGMGAASTQGNAGMGAASTQGAAGMGAASTQGTAGMGAASTQGTAGMGTASTQGTAGMGAATTQGTAGMGAATTQGTAGMGAATTQGTAGMGAATTQGTAGMGAMPSNTTV